MRPTSDQSQPESRGAPATLTVAQVCAGAAALGVLVAVTTIVGFLVGVPGVGLVLGLVLVGLIVLAALMI